MGGFGLATASKFGVQMFKHRPSLSGLSLVMGKDTALSLAVSCLVVSYEGNSCAVVLVQGFGKDCSIVMLFVFGPRMAAPGRLDAMRDLQDRSLGSPAFSVTIVLFSISAEALRVQVAVGDVICLQVQLHSCTALVRRDVILSFTAQRLLPSERSCNATVAEHNTVLLLKSTSPASFANTRAFFIGMCVQPR
jgi:hypothetical protein